LKSYFNKLQKTFESLSVKVTNIGNEFDFCYNEQFLLIVFIESDLPIGNKIALPIDYLVTQFDKVVYFIQSKLQMNKKIFARNCQIKKIDKTNADYFLDAYHFLNGVKGPFNYGLFFKEELLCVASFSKGRKMNRLSEQERSFELMRFCNKGGITVVGGLTKLIKHFCDEKKAGDVMTYIDKQIGNGKAFINVGFKLHSETSPTYFLINKKTFMRITLKSENEIFDNETFYITSNFGNLKLVKK